MVNKEMIKKIALCIFCALFLGTCVSNCSKQNHIRNHKALILQQDSIISTLSDSVVILTDSIKGLNTKAAHLEKYISLLGKNNSDLNKALNRKVVVNVTTNNDEKQ